MGLIFRLQCIVAEPVLLLQILAVTVPTQATFFMNFITVSGLRDSMLRLWRPWAILGELFGLCCMITPRDKRRLYKPEVFEYHEAYPDKAFILFIVLAYTNISPLIILFGLVYFIIMYISDGYRLLYVCKSKSHSGGMLWSNVFNAIGVGVIFYDITMIGVFLTRQKIVQYFAVSSILLMMGVIIFYLYYMNDKWYTIAFYGPMEALVDNIDVLQEEKYQYSYLHPCLKSIPLHKQECYDPEVLSNRNRGEVLQKDRRIKKDITLKISPDEDEIQYSRSSSTEDLL